MVWLACVSTTNRANPASAVNQTHPLAGRPASAQFEARIRELLQEIGRHCAFGAVYHAMNPAVAASVGKATCRLCAGCVRHPAAGALCRNNVCSGAIQGHAIGDAWYVRCWLGIDAIVVPIAPDDVLVGGLEIGGWFSPGQLRHAESEILSRLDGLQASTELAPLLSALQAMREIPFAEVRALAEFVVQATFSKGLNASRRFAARNRMFRQQERLHSKARQVHAGPGRDAALCHALGAIAACLDSPSVEPLMEALDEFLGPLVPDPHADVSRAKASASLLVALLFHRELNQNVPYTAARTRHEERTLTLDAISCVRELCIWVEDEVLSHHRHGAGSRPADDSGGGREDELQTRLLAWLQANRSGAPTLSLAATALGISVSSLTHRLKATTGRSFSEHLRAVRVAEAKRLLAYTDLSLFEIAGRCGFRDQSYFTRVFRREVNLTPGQFRRMLAPPASP